MMEENIMNPDQTVTHATYTFKPGEQSDGRSLTTRRRLWRRYATTLTDISHGLATLNSHFVQKQKVWIFILLVRTSGTL